MRSNIVCLGHFIYSDYCVYVFMIFENWNVIIVIQL